MSVQDTIPRPFPVFGELGRDQLLWFYIGSSDPHLQEMVIEEAMCRLLRWSRDEFSSIASPYQEEGILGLILLITHRLMLIQSIDDGDSICLLVNDEIATITILESGEGGGGVRGK